MSSAWMWLKLKMPFPFLERPPTHRQAPAKKPTTFLDVDHLWYAASVLNRTHGGAKTILLNPVWNLQGGRACRFRDMNWNLGTMGSLLNNSRLSLGAVSFAKVSTIKFTIKSKTCIQQPEFSSKPLLSELPLILEVYMFCQFWVWDFVGLIFSQFILLVDASLQGQGLQTNWIKQGEVQHGYKYCRIHGLTSYPAPMIVCLQSKLTNASEILCRQRCQCWKYDDVTALKYFTPSQWQDRETIVSYLAKMQQIHHNVPTPWFAKWTPPWHCPSQRKVMNIASSARTGSEALEHFVGWLLEGRQTHTRSIIIVTMTREKCGDWIQIICEYSRRYIVFVQSAPWHRKSLIFNNWSICAVNETPSSCHIQPASFGVCENRKIQLGFQLQNQEGTEWYKWHQPKIREVERFEAALTLAHPWQWASMGSLSSKRLGNTGIGMLTVPIKFFPNPNAESECLHFLSTCHIVSVMPPASHFATRQLRAKMLSDSKSGKQVGERMLGLWMVEWSKVATQHKRDHWQGCMLCSLLTLAGQKCKK